MTTREELLFKIYESAREYAEYEARLAHQSPAAYSAIICSRARQGAIDAEIACREVFSCDNSGE